MIEQLSRLLRPLATRIANLVSRAVVQRVDDSPKVQALQLDLLADETRDDVERFQNYGFTSVPLSGAEAVTVFVGGRRDHGLVVAVDDRRYRLTGLEAGEVALYTDQGDKVVIKRGGTIEVTAATKVVVAAPIVELGQPAVDAAIKGTTYASAEATFLAALSAYATAIKAIADPTNAATPTLLSAIGAFTSAASAALSTKVKVG